MLPFARFFLVVLIVSLTLVAPTAQGPQSTGNAAASAREPLFTGIGAPGALQAFVDTQLARASGELETMVRPQTRRTVENTLAPYDRAMAVLGPAGSVSSIVRRLHPDAALRKEAGALEEKVNTYAQQVSLRRDVYDALAAIDGAGLDPATRHYVERELKEFRRGGVDRAEPVRQELATLRQELEKSTQAYDNNLASGRRSFTVASAADLEGLPQDFIARHPPGTDGRITLTSDAVDVQPLLIYARRPDVRRQALVASLTVAAPENIAVLRRMLELRQRIAVLTGFESPAAYDALVRMSGTPQVVQQFLERVDVATRDASQRELAELLRRKQQDLPAATSLDAWDRRYYTDLVQRSRYGFDSQAARAYFPFARVKQGVLDLATSLYGVAFRQVTDVEVWHPSVQVYETSRDGQVIGRFYFDLHPREGKAASGAYHASIRQGVVSRQLSEAVLVASLPGGEPNDPGLMTHDQVRTLFHEFGHLMHSTLAGTTAKWDGISGIANERDFVEVPSTLAEEWIWDATVLARFARHYQTNEPIPAELVSRMRAAGEFGRATDNRAQLALAALSLALHSNGVNLDDTTAEVRRAWQKYSPVPHLDGTFRQANFTHLANPGYASMYYAYLWSGVIAKDLFTAFDARDLLNTRAATRYRDTILSRGGSKPAADLVSDFLGRPFSFTAWERWVRGE
jgi:thimet oligopeptidase